MTDEDDNLIFGFFGPYRFLSNFWPVPHGVYFAGHYFPTVEHAYQAGKTDNLEQRRAIRLLKTPGEAKAVGAAIRITHDWEDRKLLHMEACLRGKFRPGTRLAGHLLNTGTKRIVENNTWGDRFWGRCRGVGKNHLGELLMEIRDDLRTSYIRKAPK